MLPYLSGELRPPVATPFLYRIIKTHTRPEHLFLLTGFSIAPKRELRKNRNTNTMDYYKRIVVVVAMGPQ